VIEVKHVNLLKPYVQYFCERTLELSLAEAQRWAKERKVVIVNYYVQQSSKRSIIAGYEKESENTNQELIQGA
jgi:hypothetical protein